MREYFAALLLVATPAIAQVFADFTIKVAGNQGQFTAQLDYQNRPVTVSHFALLAGMEEEIWSAPPNSQALIQQGLPFRAYQSQRPRLLLTPTDTDNDNVNDSIAVRPEVPGTVRPFAPVIIPFGNTEGTMQSAFEGTRFVLKKENLVGLGERFVLRLIYSQPWFNSLGATTMDLPFYKSTTRFTSFSKGERVFMGTQPTLANANPGYALADETFSIFSTLQNPWEHSQQWGDIPFSQPFQLAMNNLGPNTGSSAFFITGRSEQPGDAWTGNFTPFGYVPRIGGNRPLVQALLDSNITGPIDQASGFSLDDIKIRIVGTTANQAFFPHASQILRIPEAPSQSFTDPPLSVFTELGQIKIGTMLEPLEQLSYLVSTDLRTISTPLIPGPSNALDESAFVTATYDSRFTGPRGFFQRFTLKNKIWPSRSFNAGQGLLNKEIEFLEKPLLQVGAKPPFDNPPRRFSMNFETNVLTRNGAQQSFAWSYDATENPYTGSITLTQMPADLPLEEIRLYFDSRVNNSSGIRRFQAFEPEEEVIIIVPPDTLPPPPIFRRPTFSGAWQDLNPSAEN